MAGPITHLALSQKVFEHAFHVKDVAAFMVGTSFPDIRYLGVIEREKTHQEEMTLTDCQRMEPFDAGVCFHALVDKIRHEHLETVEYLACFKPSRYETQAMKFFEDSLLFRKLKDKAELVHYFDTIYEEELAYGINKKDLQRWHTFLQDYLEYGVADAIVKRFVTEAGMEPKVAEEISTVGNDLVDYDTAKKTVEAFYNDFEKMLT